MTFGFPGPLDAAKAASCDTRRVSPVLARNGMIAAQHPLVSATGLRVLADGGNAIDAAVAAALVGTVVLPSRCGIGGDLFAVVARPDASGAWGSDDLLAFQGSGIGPRGASIEYMAEHGEDAPGGHRVMAQHGPLSPSVPGFVDGCFALLDRFGSRPFAELAGPAIGYAAQGFPISPAEARTIEVLESELRAYPATAAVFLPHGRAPRPGELLRQPDLARSIATIAEDFLLVVADGMGGEPAGDVASQIAAGALRDALAEMPKGDIGQALKQAYRKANDAVFQAGEVEPAYAGMGTTLTAALLHGRYATVANVGDSRAYLLRGEGITQITRDHTVVADDVAQGRVTADAARSDPRRNILTHAVGTHPRLDSKLPGIFELTLLPGDRLLLCSDGLYDVLDDVDLRRGMSGQDPAASALSLVALARERGTRDNATAVVAAAVPTRLPAEGTLPAPSRTGGIPGTAIAAVMAILLVLLLVLAVFLLAVPR